MVGRLGTEATKKQAVEIPLRCVLKKGKKRAGKLFQNAFLIMTIINI
jgi:hypothetical protein